MTTEFRVLDCGCGFNPQGDVNIDSNIGLSHHRAQFPLIPQEIPNFVHCDVLHLPFRDNTFERVFSKDALEHVGQKPQETNPGPYYMLKEMIRVSRCWVEIIVPHRFSLSNAEKRFWKRQHNAFFNVKWFQRVIPKLERDLHVKLSVRSEIQRRPLLKLFLLLPDRIHITFRKRQVKEP